MKKEGGEKVTVITLASIALTSFDAFLLSIALKLKEKKEIMREIRRQVEVKKEG